MRIGVSLNRDILNWQAVCGETKEHVGHHHQVAPSGWCPGKQQAKWCEYAGCPKGTPAAGELRGHGYRDRGSGWGMCSIHIEKRWHPADLHNRLVRYS